MENSCPWKRTCHKEDKAARSVGVYFIKVGDCSEDMLINNIDFTFTEDHSMARG
jgi:hypothetical protein